MMVLKTLSSYYLILSSYHLVMFNISHWLVFNLSVGAYIIFFKHLKVKGSMQGKKAYTRSVPDTSVMYTSLQFVEMGFH